MAKAAGEEPEGVFGEIHKECLESLSAEEAAILELLDKELVSIPPKI